MVHNLCPLVVLVILVKNQAILRGNNSFVARGGVMTLKKGVLIASICMTVTVLLVVVIVFSNLLRQSKEHIIDKLLQNTPIGTNMDDVLSFVGSNRKWRIVSKRDTGILVLNGSPSFPSHLISNEDERVIGVKSIRVHLGYYQTIFRTDVEAYYAFDENSRLITIAVKKDTDAM
jgi:hypothetical protein